MFIPYIGFLQHRVDFQCFSPPPHPLPLLLPFPSSHPPPAPSPSITDSNPNYFVLTIYLVPPAELTFNASIPCPCPSPAAPIMFLRYVEFLQHGVDLQSFSSPLPPLALLLPSPLHPYDMSSSSSTELTFSASPSHFAPSLPKPFHDRSTLCNKTFVYKTRKHSCKVHTARMETRMCAQKICKFFHIYRKSFSWPHIPCFAKYTTGANPEFPVGDGANSGNGRTPTYNLPNFPEKCMKLKKNWAVRGRVGKGAPSNAWEGGQSYRPCVDQRIKRHTPPFAGVLDPPLILKYESLISGNICHIRLHQVQIRLPTWL